MLKNRRIRMQILLAWMVLAPISATWTCVAQEPDSIHFHDSYDAALLEAKQTGKPIFLEFRCAP